MKKAKKTGVQPSQSIKTIKVGIKDIEVLTLTVGNVTNIYAKPVTDHSNNFKGPFADMKQLQDYFS
jgi:hypothetical protein